MGTQDLMDAVDSLAPEVRRQIEVKGVTCLDSCGKGPNIRLNGSLLTDVTPESLIDALKNCLNLEVC